MEINNNKLNSLPAQVEENMENIKKLAQYLKEAYKTNGITLLTTDTSISISDTNANTDVTNGWLFDDEGKLFKITSGDGTNFLIEYYADLKGPQGESGAALNIDDSSTSLTKVWSSSKTNNEISGLINDGITSNVNTWSSDLQTKLLSSGIAWTTTDKDGDDQISLNDIYIGNRTAYESTSIIKVPMLKVSDIIVYVDGNLNAKTLYRVASITGSVATVAKVCDFAQGGGTTNYEMIKVSSFQSGTRNLLCILLLPEGTLAEYSASALYQFLVSNNYKISESRLLYVMQGDLNGKILRALYYDTNYVNQIGFATITAGNTTLDAGTFISLSDISVTSYPIPLT